MKEIKQYTDVFLIGIGGIGMSALARYFKQKGLQVAGYDKTSSELTNTLTSEGIDVTYSEMVSSSIKNLSKASTLIIYTPALVKTSKLVEYFTLKGFDLFKRSEVLGFITKTLPTLAVAGTHGKTTTSAILIHLLKANGIKLLGFCGGILQNYNTNYIGDGEEVVVVEADEFDRSFLHLHPTAAVINSMDADHLDIYETTEKLVGAFQDFAGRVPKNHLYAKSGLKLKDAHFISLHENAEVQVQDIRVENGCYTFNFKTGNCYLKNLQFYLPGHHNIFNAAAALALAIDFKPQLAHSFGKALQSFKGVKRRFNYLHKTKDLVLIDDYAHHPKEIDAVHQAVSEMHPEKRTVVIFQPHLYSRTKDFAQEFAVSLARFDEVYLLDIYPAREAPIDGVTSAFLLNLIQNQNKYLITKTDISKRIETAHGEVVTLLGAGDIGVEALKLKKDLHEMD